MSALRASGEAASAWGPLGSAVDEAVAVGLAPLDAVRRAVLVAFGAPARRLVVDRELRVAALGLFTVATALAGAIWAPLWLLALGPIVLGVPHLLADVRYLVVRPDLHGRRELWAVALPLAAVAIWPMAWVGLLAAVAALAVARTGLLRRAVGLAGVSGIYALAWRYPWTANLAVVHLHNVAAVVLWWLWRPKRGPGQGAVVLAFVLGSALLLGGLVLPHNLDGPATGLSAVGWMRQLAPHVHAQWALRWVACFAFAQSVHYGLWLRLVPDDDRPRRTVRTFRATFVALRNDFGLLLLLGVGALALGLAIWGAVDLATARGGYLRFSGFHAYLEVAALVLALAEGRRPGEALA